MVVSKAYELEEIELLNSKELSAHGIDKIIQYTTSIKTVRIPNSPVKLDLWKVNELKKILMKNTGSEDVLITDISFILQREKK